MADRRYEIYRSDEVEEWSALYIDGRLDRVGDSYLIDERVAELLGVQWRDGNFLLGNTRSEDAAQTTDQIEDYENNRQAKIDRATALRAEADRLMAEANALTGR